MALASQTRKPNPEPDAAPPNALPGNPHTTAQSADPATEPRVPSSGSRGWLRDLAISLAYTALIVLLLKLKLLQPITDYFPK